MTSPNISPPNASERGEYSGSGRYDNITRMSYLVGNDTSLEQPPALVVSMTDYHHYLEGKVGLTIFFCALLSISAVVGTLGNILIILAVLTEKFLRHPGNVFIINLAIADLFVTTIIDSFNVVGALEGHKFFNGQQWLCEFIASLCAPSCAASMASICVVALNRYVRICHFNLYQSIFTWRSCTLMCIGIWIYAFLVHLPNHVGWGIGDYDNSYFICTFSIATYSYAVFYVVVAVGIPLAALTFAYVRIYQQFRQSRSRMAAHSAVEKVGRNVVAPTTARTTAPSLINDDNKSIVAQTTTGGSAAPTKSHHSSREEEEKKLIKTLFLVAAFFVGCWAPFSLFVLLSQPAYIPGWMYVISIIAAHGNSSLNWVLYGLTSAAFQDGYRHVMGKTWTILFGARIASHCWCAPRVQGVDKQKTTHTTSVAHTTAGKRNQVGAADTNKTDEDNMDLRAFA